MESEEEFYKLANFKFIFDDYYNASVTIENYNSYDKKDDHVTIPGYLQGLQVKKIGKSAFENIENIKKITIEKGISIIESYAFFNCSKLTEVELPDGLNTINSWAFFGCKNLEKINFPKSIKRIESYAFCGCKKLTKVFIPKEVDFFCNDAFVECSNLKEIIVDERNLEYSSLDGVLFNEDKTVLLEYPGGKKDKKYIVPNTVIGIESGAFMDCKNLVTIDLSGVLFELFPITFSGCDKLKHIIVQNDNPRYMTIDGVLFDRTQKALVYYPYGKNEKEYTIPNGIERIKERAFRNCNNLITVNFPESLKVIERMAFYDCKNLSSIILPKNLRSIYSSAFSRCIQLKKVTLSRNTKIGHEVFNYFHDKFVYLD
jgi:hypothetical protein